MLHGRDDERARLADLVTSARRGRAAVLAVLADPGMGKSALLQDLVATVELDQEQPAVRILTTAGVEAEGPLSFAALHRLLRPVLALDRLPAPQARALRIAFGHEDGGQTPVEPFLVGVATLSMLTEAAEDRPVLCVVDDAQWLDVASAHALLFAARQLQADSVAMVFASRAGQGAAGTFQPESLPVLHLAGLERRWAQQLLAQRTGQPPRDDVVDRLLAEAGGNPLALLELPTELSAEQLSGAAPLPPQLALTHRVEQVFLDRIRRASPDVQTLMLVAAADDTGRPHVVVQAASSLGVDATAWAEAERSGLLAIVNGQVAVRHPLVRSAVYQSVTSVERQRAHAALAQALGDDPDRQTWHRAVATDGPDAAVADALDQVGERLERRGAHKAAADAFDRAAALTSTDTDRAPRLFAGARNAWAAGEAARASALCRSAGDLTDRSLLRADIDRLRGRIEVNVGSAVTAHRIFTQAAERVSGHDQLRALELSVAAAVTQSHGVDSGARLASDTINVDSSPRDTARTRCLKQLLVSARHDIAGDPATALDELHAALQTALGAPDPLGDLDLLGNLGNAALHLGDDDAQHHFYALTLSTARENGAGMWVIYALSRLAFPQFVTGRWTDLRASTGEATTLARSVGQTTLTAAPGGWTAVLAAHQGERSVPDLVAALEDLATTHPLGILTDPVHDLSRWATGVHAAATGDAAAALHHLAAIRLQVLQQMAVADRVEAAVRADDLDQARTWVEELAAFAAATGHAWALAGTAFGRALTTSAADAPEHFTTALEHHRRARRPYERARTQLAFGEHLRRAGRRAESRPQLRAALDTFTDLGAAPMVERAAQELRASGETARKRNPSTLRDLTPMELQVARLVATGLSNKDAAARCWVSPRTVAFHLRNVFAKLGISSRGELTRLDLG